MIFDLSLDIGKFSFNFDDVFEAVCFFLEEFSETVSADFQVFDLVFCVSVRSGDVLSVEAFGFFDAQGGEFCHEVLKFFCGDSDGEVVGQDSWAGFPGI